VKIQLELNDEQVTFLLNFFSPGGDPSGTTYEWRVSLWKNLSRQLYAERFVENVMKNLGQLSVSTADAMMVRATARDCCLWGFSLDDADAYVRCMEEFMPGQDESVMIGRMQALRVKYEKETQQEARDK